MIWTADYKGQFRLGDNATVSRSRSRTGTVAICWAVAGSRARPPSSVARVFSASSRSTDCPEIIRSDNGVPFATGALARLSQLSVWWIRLGIYPETIEPAHPEQNGRHERMHRTLKRETARPPAPTPRSSAAALRSLPRGVQHGAPARSARRRHARVALHALAAARIRTRSPPVEYPPHFEMRLVSANGGIKWQRGWVNVSHVLGGEYVGFEEIDDGEWNVYFGRMKLGRFHERLRCIEDDTRHDWLESA